MEAVGAQRPCSIGMVNSKTKLRDEVATKRVWEMEELQAEMQSEQHLQGMRNSVMQAIEKARSQSQEVGTSEPLAIEELTEKPQVPEQSFSAELEGIGRASIWDSGASKGMTRFETAVGREVLGLSPRVATGAGIVTTKRWFEEQLPFGETMHVGLEGTSDTIAAGQSNAERGVETSWLAPAEVHFIANAL